MHKLLSGSRSPSRLLTIRSRPEPFALYQSCLVSDCQKRTEMPSYPPDDVTPSCT